MSIVDSLSVIGGIITIAGFLRASLEWPSVRSVLFGSGARSRRARRRKILRRYLRARKLSLRPVVGLTDIFVALGMLVFAGFWKIVLVIGLLERKRSGDTILMVDLFTVILMLILMVLAFWRICDLPAEIRNAPKVARRLKEQLRLRRYPFRLWGVTLR